MNCQDAHQQSNQVNNTKKDTLRSKHHWSSRKKANNCPDRLQPKGNLNQGSLFYLAFLGASALLVKIRTEECKPMLILNIPCRLAHSLWELGGREGEIPNSSNLGCNCLPSSILSGSLRRISVQLEGHCMGLCGLWSLPRYFFVMMTEMFPPQPQKSFPNL